MDPGRTVPILVGLITALAVALVLGAGGRLWGQRERGRVLGRPGALHDVFAADGTYLGEVRMPEGEALQAALGDTIWTFQRSGSGPGSWGCRSVRTADGPGRRASPAGSGSDAPLSEVRRWSYISFDGPRHPDSGDQS